MSTSSPTKTSAPTATAVPSGLTSYSGGCSEAAPGAPPTSLPANPREARLELRIPSMDCPNEERQIRAALERIAGVRAMKFDLGQRRLAVDAPEATWPHVIVAINQLGFETYPPTGPSASAVAQVDACATTDSCCSSACAAPVALATDAARAARDDRHLPRQRPVTKAKQCRNGLGLGCYGRNAASPRFALYCADAGRELSRLA